MFTLKAQRFLLVTILSLVLVLFTACDNGSPTPPSNIALEETDSGEKNYKDIVHLNNCAGKADIKTTIKRSFSTSIDGSITLGMDEVVKASITAKYSEYKNVERIQEVTAPPKANMEFTIAGTEIQFLGNIIADGNKTGSYTASAPLSLSVETKDLGCDNAAVTPAAENTPAPSTEGIPMSLVSAGTFTMGWSNGDKQEKPIHTVNISSYYIDQYEVTNALYKKCVEAGVCQPPMDRSSETRVSYYGNSDYDEYPVIDVNWDMARAYCTWRGARLPTEAEWEKAARGTDGRIYPWGEEVNCAIANYKGCVGDTNKVGSYENGQGPYGVYDMAGNVWEWVSDWYQDNYYSIIGNNMSDPTGPASGDGRVIRGGSWMNSGKSIRSTIRNNSDSSKSYNYVGFRCAMNANP